MNRAAIATLMGDPARRSAEACLREDAVVWLSSVRDDGRPHVVPVWFHWDGERIVAFSKPSARKVQNLRDQPRVMLAVGSPGPDFGVELIEATAELPDAPAGQLMPEAFARKYRDLLRRAGLTAERFAEVYSQPIVLRPTRFLGYGGAGWRGGALATAAS
ncbi:MAG TPA: pyridoxamine 5'-phosphate oxidase family protein [Candidatus Angelobacter sp.]|nr:pyridoxamine 5'-phosphate oxidase family protein [Candidatus Angelobacter sp.]